MVCLVGNYLIGGEVGEASGGGSRDCLKEEGGDAVSGKRVIITIHYIFKWFGYFASRIINRRWLRSS